MDYLIDVMPNHPASFITQRPPGGGLNYGSSLYYVTAHWVIRCSGNSAGGRIPTTFIRNRDIEYVNGAARSPVPILGYFPREGGHDGNDIVAILPHIDRNAAPALWSAVNGVAWATAVDEIDAAIVYAQGHGHIPKASRAVGAVNFAPDP